MCVEMRCLALLLWLCVSQTVYSVALPSRSDLTSHANQAYVQDIMRLAKAAEMRNYMNESMEPCQNFYAFACGNWAKINPANSIEHITTGLFEEMTKALNRKVAQLLHSDVEQSDTVTDNKVKSFYKSCMRINNIRSTYKQQLKQIIAEFGEMPVLMNKSDWDDDDFDWIFIVGQIAHKYGKSIILGLEIYPDFSDNTVNRVYIGYPDFPLESKAVYVDAVTVVYRDSYRLKIADDLRRFLGIPDKLAKKTAAEILDFEISLAHGMLDERLGLDVNEMSTATTLQEMEERYAPEIDIKRLVRLILGKPLNDTVFEIASDYQQNLKSVMQRTPKRIVANYIFYTLLYDFFLKNAKTERKQQLLCIDKVKSYFAKNIDNMIYRKYNTDATEHDVELIWQELKQTFKEELSSNKLSWIKRSTREYALEKLDAMQLEINSYKHTEFDIEFADLIIEDMNYVENIKHIMQFFNKRNLAKLGQPAQALEAGEILSYTPANIILENVIKIPVSLLQPNYLWAANYPNALKFGTLAALIGHELIHGFDDTGRKFDKNGNNNDWWDEESTQAFITRTECFSNQYSKYLYGGRYLPKSTAQSENIADNGGVRIAYTAYLKWYEKALADNIDLHMEQLPNMQYNSKQLFFISYAQFWCSDTHPQVRALQTSTDQHVPGKYRVIGPLSNFNEFSKEFNCALGTPMNPTAKCRIY